MSLTRCRGRRANHAPCRTPAAEGRRVCQRGSGHRSAAAAPPPSCSSERSMSPSGPRPGGPDLQRDVTQSVLTFDLCELMWFCGFDPTLDGQVLDGATFSTAAVWRQTEATNAASGPNPRTQDVIRIQIISALKEAQPIRDRLHESSQLHTCRSVYCSHSSLMLFTCQVLVVYWSGGDCLPAGLLLLFTCRWLLFTSRFVVHISV